MNFKRQPPDPNKPTFGAQLRAILELNAAPAAEIADVCGVSLKTVYSWVHDKASPPRACEVLTQEEAIAAITEHFNARARVRASSAPPVMAGNHGDSAHAPDRAEGFT